GGGPQKPSAEVKKSAATSHDRDNGDEITDDEFEALLDELHGSGSAPQEPSKTSSKSSSSKSSNAGDEDISDDEFEALLDELHGQGAAPTAGEPPAAKSSAKPAPQPAKATSAAKPAEPAKTDKKAAAAPAAPAPETTVRVDTKRLDQIMNMVGELVLVRNRLLSLSGTVQSEEMSKAISNLDVVTADIQGAVMKTRMQPIKKVFGRFPRVVRDLARSLQKDIELVLEGEETDLDKNLVEALA